MTKHDKLVKALKSIKDYSPEIIQDGGVLQDAKVAIFDEMYDTVSSIVKKYISDDEIILNISSATHFPYVQVGDQIKVSYLSHCKMGMVREVNAPFALNKR